ncbi:hypothetical protein VT98_12513 [Candidatus Electrothrix communis]|uniref:Uncharacterized protein n=1 Tax=Candidatus Electrothrix communis TaxID=1859133 RepID=A0A3S3QKD5_9BACT|nr:hypothetical protein VT98_12513 [Candidatus Electrothrix communis]
MLGLGSEGGGGLMFEPVFNLEDRATYSNKIKKGEGNKMVNQNTPY